MSLLCRSRAAARTDQGFSLVEIICVLVLLGLLASFASSSFLRPIVTHIKADNDYQQTQKSQAAILRIVLEAENSSGVAVSGNVITYTYVPLGVKRKILKSGSLLYLYTDIKNDNLKNILTDNVSAFTASYSATILSMTLTTTFSDSIAKDFSTSVYLP